MNGRGRGVVLIVVLWVVAVLAVVCLALGGTIGFKRAQLRRCRDDQAAEQALLSGAALAKHLLVADPVAADTFADAWTGTQDETFSLPVGSHRVRLFVPGARQTRWGLEDESARVNANTATAELLAGLPGMTAPVAEAFVALRDAAPAGDAGGLRTAPAGLTGPLATLGQLAQTLAEAYGQTGPAGSDRSGRSAAEDWTEASWSAGLHLPPDVAAALRHLTVYTRQRNVDAKGRPRVHLNTASAAELTAVLSTSFTEEQIQAVLLARAVRPFRTIGELLTRTMTVTDAEGKEKVVRIEKARFKPVADRLTVRGEAVLAGLVNVHTAPQEVLEALPGLTAADAAAIMGQRPKPGDLTPGPESSYSSIAWLLDVIDERAFAELCPYVTTRSQQFRFHAVADVGEAAGGSGGAAGRVFSLGVMERDGGRCRVVSWLTWHGAAGGENGG